MSRRDTIIIAVLVNAGLLMVLFATATRTDDKPQKPHKKVELAKELPTKKAKKLPKPVEIEEDILDDFLTTAFSDHTEELVLEELDIMEPEPVPQKAPVAVAAQNTVRVTVKSGDFLEKIAKAHNTTVSAIMKTNDLRTTNLRIGQVLAVPVGEKKVPAQTQSGGEYYVVKDGDSPWLIASKNRIKLDDLLRMNGLDEQKARRLRPGDRLKIR